MKFAVTIEAIREILSPKPKDQVTYIIVPLVDYQQLLALYGQEFIDKQHILPTKKIGQRK